jgi:hypothetical protein
MAVANWRNNQVADSSIDRTQCLLDTASIGAASDVQFCRDFLMRQLHQPITLDWLL